jgi:hypothetical protein
VAKRTKENITVGSGKAYIMQYSADTEPTVDTLFKEENLLGYIKGGAELSYTEETYEEKDDLGFVAKIITTTEEALLKLGLLTWNGKTLEYLVDRCKTSEASGKRTVKIGGAANSQGKEWAVGFMHEDKKDGNLWIIIRGKNTAGFTLTFAADAGTVIEPEFKALPQKDGTLIQLIEEIGEAA